MDSGPASSSSTTTETCTTETTEASSTTLPPLVDASVGDSGHHHNHHHSSHVSEMNNTSDNTTTTVGGESQQEQQQQEQQQEIHHELNNHDIQQQQQQQQETIIIDSHDEVIDLNQSTTAEAAAAVEEEEEASSSFSSSPSSSAASSSPTIIDTSTTTTTTTTYTPIIIKTTSANIVDEDVATQRKRVDSSVVASRKITIQQLQSKLKQLLVHQTSPAPALATTTTTTTTSDVNHTNHNIPSLSLNIPTTTTITTTTPHTLTTTTIAEDKNDSSENTDATTTTNQTTTTKTPSPPTTTTSDDNETTIKTMMNSSNHIHDQLIRLYEQVSLLKSHLIVQVKHNWVIEQQTEILNHKIRLLIKNHLAAEDMTSIVEHSNEKVKMKHMDDSHIRFDVLQLYEQLFYVFRTNPEHLARLTRIVRGKNVDVLLQTVIFTLFGDQFDSREENLLLQLFESVLIEEYANCANIGEFMRSNTAFTKMLSAVLRRSTYHQYLVDVLSHPIHCIIHHNHNHNNNTNNHNHNTNNMNSNNSATTLVEELNLEINPTKVYSELLADYHKQQNNQQSSSSSSSSSSNKRNSNHNNNNTNTNNDNDNKKRSEMMATLKETVTQKEAEEHELVKQLVEPRYALIEHYVSLFLTWIFERVNETPYGVRFMCKKIFEHGMQFVRRKKLEQQLNGIDDNHHHMMMNDSRSSILMATSHLEKKIPIYSALSQNDISDMDDDDILDESERQQRQLAQEEAEMESEVYSLVGGLVFLRFLNPAISTCDTPSVNIVSQKLTTTQRKNLTMICKVIQNLSNGVLFGAKEQYMVALNPILIKYAPKMRTYFEQLISSVDTDLAADQLEMEQLLELSSPDLKSINISFNEVSLLHGLCSDNMNSIAPHAHDPARRIIIELARLGPPPEPLPAKDNYYFNLRLKSPMRAQATTTQTNGSGGSSGERGSAGDSDNGSSMLSPRSKMSLQEITGVVSVASSSSSSSSLSNKDDEQSDENNASDSTIQVISSSSSSSLQPVIQIDAESNNQLTSGSSNGGGGGGGHTKKSNPHRVFWENALLNTDDSKLTVHNSAELKKQVRQSISGILRDLPPLPSDFCLSPRDFVKAQRTTALSSSSLSPSPLSLVTTDCGANTSTTATTTPTTPTSSSHNDSLLLFNSPSTATASAALPSQIRFRPLTEVLNAGRAMAENSHDPELAHRINQGLKLLNKVAELTHQEELISSEENWENIEQSILDDILSELEQKIKYKKELEQKLSALESALREVTSRRTYLNSQLEMYNVYLTNTLNKTFVRGGDGSSSGSTSSNSSSGAFSLLRRGSKKQKNPPALTQQQQQASSSSTATSLESNVGDSVATSPMNEFSSPSSLFSASALPVDVILGPYTFKFKELQKKKVITSVSLDKAALKMVKVYFSCQVPGKFNVTVTVLAKTIESIELDLNDLLIRQANKEKTIKFGEYVTCDVDALITLLNKLFVVDRERKKTVLKPVKSHKRSFSLGAGSSSNK